MKRLETLPTRSEWQCRLKYFYFHQEECMQGLKHCSPDVQFAYSNVIDTIQSSIFQKVGGCLVYSKSLDFYSYAEAMSFCLSVDLLINIILNIDYSNYSTYITKVESAEYKTFVVTLSLKTTLEVCV